MKKIMLDPGKGGHNFGIIFGELIEKDINLKIALKCKEELSRHGVCVEITRSDDSYLGYSERISAANKSYCDAFISIHCNEGGGSLTELIYSINNRGFNLADKLGREIQLLGKSAVKIYNRLGYGGVDYNTVIRETIMDSIIIKCGYLDNDFDRNFIDTLEKQTLYGIALAKGILNYLNISYIEKNNTVI